MGLNVKEADPDVLQRMREMRKRRLEKAKISRPLRMILNPL